MILSLAAPWGDPAELSARPEVILTRPDSTRFGGPIMDKRQWVPPLMCGTTGTVCVETEQESRPDGGRNHRYQVAPPNGGSLSGAVVIEFDSWAILTESFETARAFTFDTVDGFPVAHSQTAGYQHGPPRMFLCIRNCNARITIERIGAQDCAARVNTEPNNEYVSNTCVGDWYLYLDAIFGKLQEVRAALTWRLD